MPENARIDLILATRLGLLEQAVDEARTIMEAMGQQRTQLKLVDDGLSPKGRLSQADSQTRANVEDAIRRLSKVLTGRFDATLADLDREDAEDDSDGEEAGRSDEVNEDRRLLKEAFKRLWEATPSLDQLVKVRTDAHRTFQDVRRWSVAGLTDIELREASRNYSTLLDEIRDDRNPWKRYERELRGHGELLFTRYLELLGGMAVRGLKIDADDAGDEAQVMDQLLHPLGHDQPPPPERSLHLPMGTRHPPLGYSQWGLWALPLIGRTAGQHLLAKNAFRTHLDQRLTILCADVYALFAFGPSYAQAALFLELDPDDDSGDAVTDAYRAEVLLDMLPKLDESATGELTRIGAAIAEPWRAARRAVGTVEVEVSAADVDALGGFLAMLREQHAEVGYDMRWLSEARRDGRRLAAGGAALQDLHLRGRDLTVAVWMARIESPQTDPKLIQDNAKIVAGRRAASSHPSDPTRTSRQRKGF